MIEYLEVFDLSREDIAYLRLICQVLDGEIEWIKKDDSEPLTSTV